MGMFLRLYRRNSPTSTEHLMRNGTNGQKSNIKISKVRNLNMQGILTPIPYLAESKPIKQKQIFSSNSKLLRILGQYQRKPRYNTKENLKSTNKKGITLKFKKAFSCSH